MHGQPDANTPLSVTAPVDMPLDRPKRILKTLRFKHASQNAGGLRISLYVTRERSQKFKVIKILKFWE